MSTALDLVNDVRGWLREERVGALPASTDFTADPASTEILACINHASREILEDHRWPFRARYDGKIRWPAPISSLVVTNLDKATTAMTFTAGTSAAATAFNFDTQDAEPALQILLTSDSNFGSTSYRLSAFNYSGGSGTLVNPWAGTDDPTTGKVFPTEFVLLDTERVVTSVRHQERPLKLWGLDKDQRMDALYPRPSITFSENPELYYVLSGMQATGDSAIGNTGLGLGVWPIPSSDVVIDYSYEARTSAALSAATDTITGVPEQVLDLIKLKAYALALATDIQNDPKRALLVERLVEMRIPRVKRSLDMDRNRRRPLNAFGRRGGGYSLVRPWDKQIVDSP